MKISDLPKEDRPREKAFRLGVTSLSNSELLSLIIGSGVKGQSVLELSQRILNKNLDLKHLSKTNYYSLKKYKLNDEKTYRLLASFELSNRINRPDIYLNQNKISNKILIDYFTSLNLDREQVSLVIYSTTGSLVQVKNMYKGTTHLVNISPSEIVKEVLINNGKSFILVHNHPSNNCRPSQADKLSTLKIKELCDIFSITLIDHLIIGKNNCFSFKQESLLENIDWMTIFKEQKNED